MFDVAGVLTQSYLPILVAGAQAVGADLDAIAAELGPVFTGETDPALLGHRLEQGDATLEEFLASLGAVEEAARAVLHPSGSHYFGNQLQPEPIMHAFVTEVRGAGFLTAVVSNNVREWQDAWDSVMPDLGLFDAVVMSADTGFRKPSAAIYELALDRLGVEPHEALFLDDFALMAEGARRVGITSIDVTDHADAIAEARHLLGI